MGTVRRSYRVEIVVKYRKQYEYCTGFAVVDDDDDDDDRIGGRRGGATMGSADGASSDSCFGPPSYCRRSRKTNDADE